jgi:hypothetical protein
MGSAVRRNLRGIRAAKVINSAPDFFQAGNDGALPENFPVWRCGVTYTVRSEILAPLHRGQQYWINATVRRKIAEGEFRAYAGLYDICIGILSARSALLTSSDPGEPLHTWVQWHAWWCGAISDKYPTAGDSKIACASITLGLAFPKTGESRAQGQNAPEPVQLLKPGGAMTDPTAPDCVLAQRPDEAHIVFDFNDPAFSGKEITLSYGEYVPPAQGNNFEPFVRRAERLAEFYRPLLFQEAPFEIIRREWFRITDSNFVVVMIYFRQVGDLPH